MMNEILKKAHERQIPVEMIYISQHNEITKRTVFIKKITSSSIQGYCLLRNKQRKFAINNILAVQLAKRWFHYVSSYKKLI